MTLVGSDFNQNVEELIIPPSEGSGSDSGGSDVPALWGWGVSDNDSVGSRILDIHGVGVAFEENNPEDSDADVPAHQGGSLSPGDARLVYDSTIDHSSGDAHFEFRFPESEYDYDSDHSDDPLPAARGSGAGGGRYERIPRGLGRRADALALSPNAVPQHTSRFSPAAVRLLRVLVPPAALLSNSARAVLCRHYRGRQSGRSLDFRRCKVSFSSVRDLDCYARRGGCRRCCGRRLRRR